MILAGIDEAGYGPILGPLCVGCCAVRLEEGQAATAPALPDVWKLLRRAVDRKRDRRGHRLQINDSKQVYTPGAGLTELERSVLAWARCAGLDAATLDELVAVIAPGVLGTASAIEWYSRAEEAHPVQADATSVAIAANALKQECRRVGVVVLPPRAEVLFESDFNHLCDTMRNKSSVLFTLAARHIDRLLADHAAEGVTIVCDRHGGRSHYAPLLRLMWSEWDLSVVEEQEKRAEYELSRGSAVARLLFVEKGDGLCLPTAMSSMIAKYLRERLMGRFNAFWRRHAPEIKPTAGYWNDGLRFLAETALLRQRMGVQDHRLVRQR